MYIRQTSVKIQTNFVVQMNPTVCPSLIFVHWTTNFNSSAICYCTSKWQVILLFLKPTFLYQILMYSPLHIHFFPILLELPNNLLLFVFSVYINMPDFIWWLTLFTVELMQCNFWKLIFPAAHNCLNFASWIRKKYADH